MKQPTREEDMMGQTKRKKDLNDCRINYQFPRNTRVEPTATKVNNEGWMVDGQETLFFLLGFSLLTN
jgi:hypothetical protein